MNIQKQQGKILLELPEPEILEKRPIRNKDIPSESGVYFIYDESGNLIYHRWWLKNGISEVK